jgi:hypothetical protein
MLLFVDQIIMKLIIIMNLLWNYYVLFNHIFALQL